MNDTLKTLYSRRSVRRFTNKPIESPVLEEILKAAQYAPSGLNLQPRHFMVIDDREKMELIMQLHPYTSMLKTAPCCVLICGDQNASPDMWRDDCAASAQNMLLAAKSLEVCGCWCAVYPFEDRCNGFIKAFGLPDGIMPYCVVPLGYSDAPSPQPERHDPQKIHHNAW